MKIRIEMTKSEVATTKRIAKKLGKEVIELNYSGEDYDFTEEIKEGKRNVSKKVDEIMSTSTKFVNPKTASMITTADNGELSIEIDIKSGFYKAIMGIVDIAYSGIIKLVCNLACEIIKVFDKFM